MKQQRAIWNCDLIFDTEKVEKRKIVTQANFYWRHWKKCQNIEGFLNLKTLKKVSKHWLRVSGLWRSDKKIAKMSATKLSLSTTKTKHIKVKHPKRKLYRLIIFRVPLLYTDHFIKEFEQKFYMAVKVSFCQTVQCSSKECAKSLSWAEILNFLSVTLSIEIFNSGYE